MTVTSTGTMNKPGLTVPWPHQQEAIDCAADKPGTMLAMEMGTGKTLVAIHLLHLWGARRVLILCPKSVDAWPKEFAKHASEQGWEVKHLIKGTVAKRMEQVAQWHNLPRNIPVAIVLNYDVMSRPAAEKALRGLPWDVLVMDEAARLKSAAGKQSRAVSRLADAVPRRLGLTGTPMPHSPLDIYAQYRAIDKRVFGISHAAFCALYAVRGGYLGHEVVGYQNLDELHEKMYSIAYRCRAADVLSLPEVADQTAKCDLGPEAARVYKQLKKHMIAEINDGTVTAANALVKLLRLQQVTSGYVPIDDSVGTITLGNEKRRLLAETLEDLAPFEPGMPREPVVVFARFRHDLTTIRAVADEAGLRSAELSGSANDLAAWQAGDADVLAVQLQAGGLGVDLSRARYCVYYSTDYSLGNYLQSRARVHRPGQTRAVTYIHLVARGTVDEDVIEALAKREEVVSFVVDKLAGRG